LAVGSASVHGGFRVRARPPGPEVGHAEECRRSRLIATGLAGGLGLVGVGDLQGAGRAQPDDDVGSWVLPGRADVGLHSALVGVGLPHNGHGRGTDLVALIGGPRPGSGSGRRWS
jgi:hypothetical protein